MEHSSISRLVSAIPPPESPIGVSGEWSKVEQALGVPLPEDYKDFIETYGTGGFFPFELRVWNVFEDEVDAEFIISQNEFAIDADTSSVLLEDFAKSTPIFPWAADGVGSEYFWAMRGKPNEWYVLVTVGGLKYYQFLGFSVSRFLAELFLDQNEAITSLWSADGSLKEPQYFQSIPK